MLSMILLSLLFVLKATASFHDVLPFKLPFHTGPGPHIWSADGKEVQYVGTNWPGHQEAMIPEGLQYSSISGIVNKIRALNLNVVRLTFAIQLVDDILDDGGDVTLEDTLTNALGTTNGTIILNKILANNPQLSRKTTRLQVFDAVANELAAQGIYLHLDNHVSKAIWCCSTSDGNAWFGDSHFNVTNWLRGWKFMASHASKNWPSFSSVGLRNELRQPDASRGEPYDWYTWYTHMTTAASIVHSSAPDALIFFSGLNYDVITSPLTSGYPLNGTAGTGTAGKSAIFAPEKFEFKDKIVLELHKYDFEHTQASCSSFGNSLITAGYSTLNTTSPAVTYHLPMVLSEWGFIQNGTYWNQTSYNECLIQFMGRWKPSGWMQWEVSGSFYVKTSGGVSVQDLDEAWGLLDHEWKGVRSRATVDNSLRRMVEATLKG